MPLDGDSSLCEERQPVIVSRDAKGRREHRALNMDACLVTQYRIDGTSYVMHPFAAIFWS